MTFKQVDLYYNWIITHELKNETRRDDKLLNLMLLAKSVESKDGADIINKHYKNSSYIMHSLKIAKKKILGIFDGKKVDK
ncbi:hypothetical protein M0R01_03845 [bacterium]|nr:hypothetical protein [bacterium]